MPVNYGMEAHHPRVSLGLPLEVTMSVFSLSRVPIALLGVLLLSVSSPILALADQESAGSASTAAIFTAAPPPAAEAISPATATPPAAAEAVPTTTATPDASGGVSPVLTLGTQVG